MPLPLRQYPSIIRLYLPNEGQNKDEVLEFTQPAVDELPYANFETIKALFKALSIENIILLLKNVLLDTSCLFLSKKTQKLVNCCEAIKSLLYPFKFE